MRYRDYFDQAGNQKKLLPGEFIGSDFVPGRDDEPDFDEYFRQQYEERLKKSDPSKVKIVQDYFDAVKRHNELVDACDYALGRRGEGGPRWKRLSRELSEYDEKTFKPAEKKLHEHFLPIIKQLFPEFGTADTEVKVSKYSNGVDGHVFLVFKTFKSPHSYQNKQMVVIRDDGIILPEFSQMFADEHARDDAFAAFRKATEAKKNESEKLKESADPLISMWAKLV